MRVWLSVKGTQEEEEELIAGDLSKRHRLEFASLECLYEGCELPEPGAVQSLPDAPDGVWSDGNLWNAENGFIHWEYRNGTAGAPLAKPVADTIVSIEASKNYIIL